MNPWLIVLTIVVVVLVSAWRLTYTAARLDRLHARVEGSLASLDAQLVRRAEMTLELGRSTEFDPATALLLVAHAAASLEAAESALVTHEVQEVGVPIERCTVESELTDVLSAVVAEWPSNQDAAMHRRFADACVRVELAHRFHNEAVRDVRRVRAKWFVRVFHLAGHTVLPREVDFDDYVVGLDIASSAW